MHWESAALTDADAVSGPSEVACSAMSAQADRRTTDSTLKHRPAFQMLPK